jgi:hypothetical protein
MEWLSPRSEQQHAYTHNTVTNHEGEATHYTEGDNTMHKLKRMYKTVNKKIWRMTTKFHEGCPQNNAPCFFSASNKAKNMIL